MSLVSREKEESLLMERYEKSIILLQNQHLDEGIQMILEIIDKDLNIQEFKSFIRSCYLSLASAFQTKKEPKKALFWYYKAIKLKEDDYLIWQKLG